MKLRALPFESIASGSKTIELRLFDEKRRKIDVGDSIEFTNLDEPTKKTVVFVHSLHRYASFEDLFKDISPVKCGFNSMDTTKAVAEMRNYYSDDQILKYGVLGIGVKLPDMHMLIKHIKEQYNAEFERLFPNGIE